MFLLMNEVLHLLTAEGSPGGGWGRQQAHSPMVHIHSHVCNPANSVHYRLHYYHHTSHFVVATQMLAGLCWIFLLFCVFKRRRMTHHIK